MSEVQVPSKLLPFLQKNKRFKIAVGGRGGAKSMSFADMLLLKVTQGQSIACGREFQNSIDDSVHSLMREELSRLSLPGFSHTTNKITHISGGQIVYKGLARNPESIKSLHGTDIFWVEEAQTLSQRSLALLTPTIREVNSEIWFSLNLGSSNDPMAERFIKPFEKELFSKGYYEDDLHYIVLINYFDNPWFPPELDKERKRDKERLPRAEYDHIWLGRYSDAVENSIIEPDWFDAAIDAHKKLGFEARGAEVVSHDPSDRGPDDKGLCHRHGSVIKNIVGMDRGGVNEGFDWATGYALEHRVDKFIWDGDGMGASLLRQADQAFNGKNVDYYMFRGSEGVTNPNQLYDQESILSSKKRAKTNKETFFNRRSQYYWLLRDRFYLTYLAVEKKQYQDPGNLISISSDIEAIDLLRAEVCKIPRKTNANGYIQIMTKKEMKSAPLNIPSPNLSDTLMMSMYVDYQQVRRTVTQQPQTMGGWT